MSSPNPFVYIRIYRFDTEERWVVQWGIPTADGFTGSQTKEYATRREAKAFAALLRGEPLTFASDVPRWRVLLVRLYLWFRLAPTRWRIRRMMKKASVKVFLP